MVAGGSQRGDAPPNAARRQRADAYREQQRARSRQRRSSRSAGRAASQGREQQCRPRGSSRRRPAASQELPGGGEQQRRARPAASQWSDVDWRRLTWQWSPVWGWWNLNDWQEWRGWY